MPLAVGGADLGQTFGMKNKNKSSKVQKYIATVEKQASAAGKNKQDVRSVLEGLKLALIVGRSQRRRRSKLG